MKKIKIFLGAYVNYANAQNVNCDNIARYLDKDKFEVHAMYTTMCPVDKKHYKELGVHLHAMIHHRVIWYWSKIFAMFFAKADIYYLPKLEPMDYFFMKHNKRKNVSFVSSIEGVVGEQISSEHKNQYSVFDDCFSISNCVAESAKKYWNMDTETLYLGIDLPNKIANPDKKTVKNVIWVGSLIERKRPQLLLECAKLFPNLSFTMIGDGDIQDKIKGIIETDKISNVTLTGRIPNTKVYDYMKESDVLLMTSDKEGLPKVIGEAMSFGLPAIYINECYNVDYIKDSINGYAVPDFETLVSRLQFLADNSETYGTISNSAYETIQPYTWQNLIHSYENYFIKQYEKKQRG